MGLIVRKVGNTFPVFLSTCKPYLMASKKKKIINRKIRLIKSLLLIDKNKTIFDIKKKEL
jgi:hypothetical protein